MIYKFQKPNNWSIGKLEYMKYSWTKANQWLSLLSHMESESGHSHLILSMMERENMNYGYTCMICNLTW